jgi:hypothetical protein
MKWRVRVQLKGQRLTYMKMTYIEWRHMLVDSVFLMAQSMNMSIQWAK